MVEYKFATDEQINLADTARAILEKYLVPRLHDLENANNGRGEFPMDVLKILAEAGYFCMDIPEEWGGLGFDTVTRCIIHEEMAKIDAGFAFNFNGAGLNWPYILETHMPDAEKHKWIDGMLAGDITGAIGYTESCAGSDAAAIRTTAKFDEKTKEWVINGTKIFVTNGVQADFYIVSAWTDRTKTAGHGISFFFVEKERGPQVGHIEEKLGLKLSETAEVIFDGVRVPEDHLVGEEGAAFKMFMRQLDASRVAGMVYALGISQAALDHAVTYAKTRETFGRPIIEHQGLNFKLAEMQIRTDAARALLYEGAALLDKGIPLGTVGSSSKAFVTETCVQNALDAIQVYGGYGYMKDYPVEKLLRDSKIFTIFDGTTEIQKLVIGRMLNKKYE